MRKLILAISAAAMAASLPAVAQAESKGKGPVKAQKAAKAKPAVKTHSRTDARIGSDRAVVRHGTALNACPPGLAKKSPPCLPPGQAKRLFEQGQRIPAGYNFFTNYRDIPEIYRSRVPFDDDFRYIYRDDAVYVVDPSTRLVTNIIDLIR